MNPLVIPILEVGGKILDKFFSDPAERAKAQLDLMLMQQNGELKELEVRMSAILAEANSEDPWTSRARPSFLYVFYFIILSMVFLAPLLGVFFPHMMDAYFLNVEKGFDAIPEEMWWAFTAGYLGYAGARTMEKNKGMKK